MSAIESTSEVRSVPTSYTSVPDELLLQCTTDPVPVLADLFAGRTTAFGCRKKGESRTSKKSLAVRHYLYHLNDAAESAWSLGVIPIREDNTCLFGAIDYDKPNLTDDEALAIVQQSAFAKLPLMWALSKSRGLHGYLFLSEPQAAEAVRRVLHHWAVTVFQWRPKDPDDNKTDKAGFFEIFPKQDRVDPRNVGNFIHLPWSGGASSPRYGFNLARRVTFGEWLAFALSWRVTPEMFATWATTAPPIPGASAPTKSMPNRTNPASAPTLSEAGQLLDALNVESRLTPHDSWVRVGMALYDAFGETGDADAALDLWDEHSRRADNYTEGECEKRWRSFHAERERKVTFRTLRAWAKEDRAATATGELAETIKRFNRQWALVLSGGNAILETPTRGEPQFHEYQRWKRFVANEQVEIAMGKVTKLVPLVDVWLGHPDRRSYRGIVFDPAHPPYAEVPARIGADGDFDFNLWPGLALKPKGEGSCDLLLTHLRDVICRGSDEVYRWVLMWLAHIVQHPGRLAGTALALRGPQGTGKSIVGEIMGEILGDGLYAKVSKPGELTGRFNVHHKGRLLLQVEEGFWAGDKAAEGAIKHIITSKVIMVEPKFVDPFPVENFVRLLITSNKDWVVPAGFGERRFAVLDVSEARKDDRAYHGALRREMFEDGGCARFLHHLLHEVEVNESVIWRPPVTEALTEQQIESLSDEDTWLFDILNDAAIPGDSEGKGRALKDAVFNHYIWRTRDLGRTRRSSETKLGMYLKNGSPLGKYAVKTAEIGSKTYYVFPPLAACREAFTKRLAGKVEWLVSATEWRRSQWGLNDSGASYV